MIANSGGRQWTRHERITHKMHPGRTPADSFSRIPKPCVERSSRSRGANYRSLAALLKAGPLELIDAIVAQHFHLRGFWTSIARPFLIWHLRLWLHTCDLMLGQLLRGLSAWPGRTIELGFHQTQRRSDRIVAFHIRHGLGPHSLYRQLRS
jgi:hypothetical protein